MKYVRESDGKLCWAWPVCLPNGVYYNVLRDGLVLVPYVEFSEGYKRILNSGNEVSVWDIENLCFVRAFKCTHKEYISILGSGISSKLCGWLMLDSVQWITDDTFNLRYEEECQKFSFTAEFDGQMNIGEAMLKDKQSMDRSKKVLGISRVINADLRILIYNKMKLLKCDFSHYRIVLDRLLKCLSRSEIIKLRSDIYRHYVEGTLSEIIQDIKDGAVREAVPDVSTNKISEVLELVNVFSDEDINVFTQKFLEYVHMRYQVVLNEKSEEHGIINADYNKFKRILNE